MYHVIRASMSKKQEVLKSAEKKILRKILKKNAERIENVEIIMRCGRKVRNKRVK